MKSQPLKFVIVVSTGGSVMNELFKNSFFKKHIFSVVSDRDCPALEKAQNHQVTIHKILEPDKSIFSDRLLAYLQENRIDYVISFFTKLFVGNLLEVYRHRIINLHLSLLPSFKGLTSFDDAIQYGVRYIGTTLHFIDQNMDEGQIILQTIHPLDDRENYTWIRHRIFEQQCKSLLQVVKWLVDERISIMGNRVSIEAANFSEFEYSPNLDFREAVDLKIPDPTMEKNHEI